MTLSEFLLARIAEDAKEAGAAEAYFDVTAVEVRRGYVRHLARWSPARVLAECEAKRDLIALSADRLFDRTYANDILQPLAAIYADHPDYDPAWR